MDVSGGQTAPLLGGAEMARAYFSGSANCPRGHPVTFASNRCHDQSLTCGRYTSRHKHRQNHTTFHILGGKVHTLILPV